MMMTWLTIAAWTAASVALLAHACRGCADAADTDTDSDRGVPFDPVEDFVGGSWRPLLDPLGWFLGIVTPALPVNFTTVDHLLSFAFAFEQDVYDDIFDDVEQARDCLPDGVVLAAGDGMHTGDVCLQQQQHHGLLWQSSGQLVRGCPQDFDIRDCYSLFLTANASQQLDPGGLTPRQRIELLTPGYQDGASAVFIWKSFLSESVSTSQHFFHLFQLYTRSTHAPVLTLDAKRGLVGIFDPLRCPRGCGDGTWIPLSEYVGRTMLHIMKVTFGMEGRVEYGMADLQSGEVKMGYSAVGPLGHGSTSLKFGTYRAAVPDIAYVGDFVAFSSVEASLYRGP